MDLQPGFGNGREGHVTIVADAGVRWRHDSEHDMSESFTGYLRDLFSELGPVALRKMFGGQGIYYEGLIIGLVIGEELFLKTDAETVGAFERAGGQPFVYQGKGKPVTMSYWLPPAEAMESAQAMRPWAKLAYEASVRKNGDKKTMGKKPADKRPVSSKPTSGKPTNSRPVKKTSAGERKR
jgi:DNA transformation protein and related proteins